MINVKRGFLFLIYKSKKDNVEEKKMSKISVIIPIYNEEKYLDECIQSVMKQKLKDIEIICVNDGSTDKSKEIMEKYAALDSRIKIIDKKNTGYGNTMNCGLDAATGDYIGIVESDDYIMDYMYEKLYALTENGSVDMVKGNFWDCYDETDGSITKVTNQERANMPEVEDAFTIRQHPELLWGHPSVWSAIYKRDFLKKNGIRFKEVKGAGWVDNPFFFDTLCSAESIKWTREPFYCYRKLNLASSSTGYDLALPFERMMDNLEVLKKRNYNDEEILKFAYARALMYLCGAMEEKHYEQKKDYARPYMQKMMKEINPNVITDNFHLGDQKNYWKYISPLKLLIPQSAKILIYNWVPFDNPGHVGGGVTTYCRNLIAALLRERPDVQVYFLSSGWAYDISRTDCYIRKLSNEFGERCRSFEVVNSPVPAAQNMLLNNPTVGYESKELKEQIAEFIKKYGPFKDIHFNNIEGLSLDIMDLKREYPDTRFIFSIHNYTPFCMTGFYFQRHNHCNCNPNHTAEDCLACTNINRQIHLRKDMVGRAKVNVWNANDFDEFAWVEAFNFARLDKLENKKEFLNFTKMAVNKLNKNMDVILAVSDKVRKIAIENGIKAEKVITNYIGTKIADYQVQESTAKVGKYLRIAFLGTGIGYEEKGYPFLMKALESMEEKYASKIALVLTTTDGNDEEMKRRLSKFHSVEIIHGYSHKDLHWILRDVNLGIIPVMWEDNLPQIAIEMVAMGVPVLCSSYGGASELCSSDMFRFRGGNEKEFLQKVIHFLQKPEDLNEFWKNHNGLVTMKMHVDELSKIYELPEKPTGTISLEDYSLLLAENEFLYSHFENSGVQNIVQGNVEEKDRIIHQMQVEKEQKEQEIRRLQMERDNLQYSIDETRKSVSYKAGRALTLLPRMLRGDK